MTSIDYFSLVETCMCTNIRKVSRLITKLYDAKLKPSGININQLAIMLTIQGFNVNKGIEPTVKELSFAMAVDPSTLSRNLRVLEDMGLISMRTDEANRTQKTIKLTEKGSESLMKAYPLWLNVQDFIRGELGEENFNQLIFLLQGLEHILVTSSMP